MPISTPELETPVVERVPSPEEAWDLSPMENLMLRVAFLMAPLAPPNPSQIALLDGMMEEFRGVMRRVHHGEPLEEALSQALRVPFSVKLRPGRRPAWTVGVLEAGLAILGIVEGLGRPLPSRPTIRKALAHLVERGILRREDRGAKGGRPVYRFARLPVDMWELILP